MTEAVNVFQIDREKSDESKNKEVTMVQLENYLWNNG